MAEITAAMVKGLREATGLGMMECKKALQEADGDPELAKDILRKKGLESVVKKAGRPTSEGLIAIHVSEDQTAAAMVEVRCETDFVARNEVFRAMVRNLARMAAEAENPVQAQPAMQEALQEVMNKVGENMTYGRGVKILAPRIGTYVHHNGKVGVLVGVEGQVSDEMLADLCMHIAFANPMGLTTDDIPVELVEKEKEIATHQAMQLGKPENVVEKIVAGKVNKFLAANALLEQPFVRDDKKKVKNVLGGAKVLRYARFAVGADAS